MTSDRERFPFCFSSVMMGCETSARYGAAKAALGERDMERVRKSRILVVGAGGIGCELLKNLVLSGVGHIDIVRAQSTDLTNALAD